MEDTTEQKNQNMEVENDPKILEKAIKPVISSSELTNEQKVEKVSKIMAQVIAVSHESFSGPMPHPDILRGYKELIPDAPERILQMAEQEQKHRIDIEQKMIEQNGKNINEAAIANARSQFFAFILTLVFILAGVALTIVGYMAVGLTIFGTTILGVVTVFIKGYEKRSPKTIEK